MSLCAPTGGRTARPGCSGSSSWLPAAAALPASCALRCCGLAAGGARLGRRPGNRLGGCRAAPQCWNLGRLRLRSSLGIRVYSFCAQGRLCRGIRVKHTVFRRLGVSAGWLRGVSTRIVSLETELGSCRGPLHRLSTSPGRGVIQDTAPPTASMATNDV